MYKGLEALDQNRCYLWTRFFEPLFICLDLGALDSHNLQQCSPTVAAQCSQVLWLQVNSFHNLQ